MINRQRIQNGKILSSGCKVSHWIWEALMSLIAISLRSVLIIKLIFFCIEIEHMSNFKYNYCPSKTAFVLIHFYFSGQILIGIMNACVFSYIQVLTFKIYVKRSFGKIMLFSDQIEV